MNTFDVDEKYPELSALAQSYGQSLKSLATQAEAHDGHLRFNDCCHMVSCGVPRHSHADSYNYLATLNELIKRLGDDLKAKSDVWRKLNSKRLFKSSIFLDTVSEAAWSIYFIDRGYKVSRDVPFDSSDANSKDADLVIDYNSRRFWFDVVTFESKIKARSARGSIAGGTISSVFSILEERAIKKYNSKFKKAICSGVLSDASVGILVCFIKAEADIIPPLLLNLNDTHRITPPRNLFAEANVGLDYVYAYTMFSNPGSDYLLPHPFFKWVRNPDSPKFI